MQDTGRWVNGLFLPALSDWLVMSFLFCESKVRVPSSSRFLPFAPSRELQVASYVVQGYDATSRSAINKDLRKGEKSYADCK